MLPKMKPNIFCTYSSLFVFALLLLAGSFILQYGFGLQPCPLCIFARMVVIALTILFGLMVIHRPKSIKGIRAYALSGFLLISLGIAITARHLWIIHLPPEKMPSCSPDFNYLIENFPLKEALMIILKSSGECAENNQTFLGFILPEWTLFAFVLFALGCIYLWWQSRSSKHS